MLALTATATDTVKADILKQLGIETAVVVQGKYNRENLFYEVRSKAKVQNVANDIGSFIKSQHPNDTGIIYCNTKHDCETLCKLLKTNHKLSCEFYHSQVPDGERRSVQERWMQDRVRVIVATTAFGLGIDKKSVRFVIHQSMPKSLDNYIQECGRAGRDGQLCHCVMYYDFSDKRIHEALMLQNLAQNRLTGATQCMQANMHKIMDYCEELYMCRRKMLLEYLGESFRAADCKGMCDNCKLRGSKAAYLDYQREAKLAVDLLSEVALKRRKLATLLQTAEYLHGKNRKKLEAAETPMMAKMYGALKHLPLVRIRAILLKLLLNRVLPSYEQ